MTNRRQILQRRRQLMLLRCRINPWRRFDVRSLGDGWWEYTCRTCGAVEKRQQRAHADVALTAKLERYWQDRGVTGHCKRCTKRARDERHPLPKLPKETR
jgi:hypothetical protein